MARASRPEPRTEDVAAGNIYRPTSLASPEKQRVRRLRRRGKSVAEIVADTGFAEADVLVALGAMRGHRSNSNHVTLSVDRATGEWFAAERKYPREPMWQVMGRIVSELEWHRAMNATWAEKRNAVRRRRLPFSGEKREAGA
jgi:hypothetical protein